MVTPAWVSNTWLCNYTELLASIYRYCWGNGINGAKFNFFFFSSQREQLFYTFLVISFCMSVVLLFAWIETSNEYFDFDRWVSHFVFSFVKGLFSLIAIWTRLKRAGGIRGKVDKTGLSTVGGWEASLWGGVRMLNTLSYFTFYLYWLSHLDQMCVLSGKFLCASNVPSPIQVIPWHLFPQSFCLGYWCLCWLVFTVSIHEPWCLCLTSIVCLFSLSLRVFLRLWIQKWVSLLSILSWPNFCSWTAPSFSGFLDLIVLNLTHYLFFWREKRVYLSMRLLKKMEYS